MDYLYMLREQLAYSLSNLGLVNINPSSLDEIGSIITQPLFVRLEGQDGEITNINVALGQISTQIADVEGNMSSFSQTAEDLTVRVENVEGDVNTLQVSAESFSSRLSSAEGDISQLFQTSSSISSRVANVEGDVSTLEQTATSITARVSTLEGEYTEISATVNGLTLTASNGSQSSVLRLMSGTTQLSSATVQITGMVTFYDLEHTSTGTVINGGNITTGIIEAIDIEACNIDGSSIFGSVFETLLEPNGDIGGEIIMYYEGTANSDIAGGIRLDDQGSEGDSPYRMFVYTETSNGERFALKLLSAGDMSIESSRNIFIAAGYNDEITIGEDTGTNVINLVGVVRVNGTEIS